jgi:hypothetical protein
VKNVRFYLVSDCCWSVDIHILFDWSLDKILIILLEVGKMKNGWEWAEKEDAKKLVKKGKDKLKEVVDEVKEWQ